MNLLFTQSLNNIETIQRVFGKFAVTCLIRELEVENECLLEQIANRFGADLWPEEDILKLRKTNKKKQKDSDIMFG